MRNEQLCPAGIPDCPTGECFECNYPETSNSDIDASLPRIFSHQVGGDVNWWTYGADFLCFTVNPDDDDDEYHYLVHIEGIEGSHPDQEGEIDENDPTLEVEVYRYYLPDSKEKLFEDLNWVTCSSVYESADIDPDEIGNDPLEYVQLAISAFEYYGWMNADSYPASMTESAIKQYLNLDE